jgi:hypothetical protein
MDIYSFAHSSMDYLLLVDGNYVVNGDYELENKKGRLFVPGTYTEAVHLGKASKVYRFTNGRVDYNLTLEVARKNLSLQAMLRPTKKPRKPRSKDRS